MVSQRGHHRDEPVPVVEEQWHIMSAKWWHTPLSSVSWSYEPEKASQNALCAKPPHYHLSLHNERAQPFDEEDCAEDPLNTPSEWHSPSTCRIAEDNALNEELIGVKNAGDVLRLYEQAVGFDHSSRPEFGQEDTEKKEKLRNGVSAADVQLGKELWDELVNDLFGGKPLKKLLMEAREKPKSATNVLKKSLAVPNSNIDYFSRPSTPKPFILNPSASSFVPLGSPNSTFSSSCSSSSESSDHVVSFSFPSLNGSLPPPPSNKTDPHEYANGLHMRCRTMSSDGSSVASNERPSSGFLPSFLFDSANQRRRPTRTSRTRAIVDQLRSQHQQDGERTSPVSQNSSPTVSDFGVGNLGYFKSRLTVSDGSSVCSTTPPLTEEDYHHHDGVGIVSWADNLEGWTVPPAPAPIDPETKRSRSKELLMTLRRRTDSLTSNANAAASLAAARSLGTVPPSTPPVIVGSERLVESPEPVEDGSTMWPVESCARAGEEEGWFESSSQSHQSASSRTASPTLYRQMAGAESDHNYSSYNPSFQDARAHLQTPTNPQTYAKPTNTARYPQRYTTNQAPVLPYTLLGYPLPVSGVPTNVGVPLPISVPAMPMTMAMGNPRAGMQVPVQVPVQTVQYSTLMHLRIMQQMQMMRNNMNTTPGGTIASTELTR